MMRGTLLPSATPETAMSGRPTRRKRSPPRWGSAASRLLPLVVNQLANARTNYSTSCTHDACPQRALQVDPTSRRPWKQGWGHCLEDADTNCQEHDRADEYRLALRWLFVRIAHGPLPNNSATPNGKALRRWGPGRRRFRPAVTAQRPQQYLVSPAFPSRRLVQLQVGELQVISCAA